ncbi:hypothetical protein HanRHA438_Chr13g0599951 [Helianthus annuus]|nr:hypothetical protein HanIR_Chr13g0641661 [Helianthus annuus]KAJ0858336.1 hypothetical protein HanRHA438_Chr13g0599951 [Helianthus annuus]
MSATRLVSESQVMPYHLLQQSVPVHDLKMPKFGSCKPALNASNAARSEGGQAFTGMVTENDIAMPINQTRVLILLQVFLSLARKTHSCIPLYMHDLIGFLCVKTTRYVHVG